MALKYQRFDEPAEFAFHNGERWLYTPGLAPIFEDMLDVGELVAEDGQPLLASDSQERLEQHLPTIICNESGAFSVIPESDIPDELLAEFKKTTT